MGEGTAEWPLNFRHWPGIQRMALFLTSWYEACWIAEWSFSTNFCLLEFSSWRAEARKESLHSQCGGRVVPEWVWGFIRPPRLLFPLRACPQLSSTNQKREVAGPWEERGVQGRSVSWKLGRRAACYCVFSPTALGWAGTLRSKNKWLFFFPLGKQVIK